MLEAKANVLVVDDDDAVAKVLSTGLLLAQIASARVTSGEDALGILERRHFDAILTDVRMPGISGMALLPILRRKWPETPVILLTGHGTVRMAVDAMKDGAIDFLTKPFDLDEVVALIARVLELSASRAHKVPSIPVSSDVLATRSPVMLEVEALLRRAAQSDCTVLLTGETGAGKEVAARLVHSNSGRAAKPFVAIHCGALPDNLLESELFGYERGAFTGAVSRKPGRFELAEGGTLFLDEIGDTSTATQVKLLRVLHEKTFERLGGVATLRANVRFIAATHRDLASMSQDGRFREDLYYRLSVCPIRLPALRERREDIVPLVQHFARVHCARRSPAVFERRALDLLLAQPWPGNIRQLENLVEHIVLLADGRTISDEVVLRAMGGHDGPRTRPGPALLGEPSLESSRREAERQAVKAALERSFGNRTQAARLLGVSRRTLYNKLHEYGLE